LRPGVQPVRILVVDDAVVARRVISDILASEDDFEVVGTAPDGNLALKKIARLHPDVVTLDIDMPNLDGMQTLSAIRSDYPKIRVIMVSNHTRRGAAITVEALFSGASDYVTKAARASSAEEARAYLREQLVPKIRALAPAGGRAAAATRPGATPPVLRRKAPKIEVVVIGSSTGGPNALTAILEVLPADFEVPVLIVQHLPENFTTFLANRLDSASRLPVREATNRTRLEPGTVWIAPGNLHLETRSTNGGIQLATTEGPLVNSCRPAADVLFRSAAKCYGASVLAVVLTGMGQDGLDGCRDISAAGGRVIVQDRATSVVWGMPGQVAGAGLAELVLPVTEIGAEIVRRVKAPRR
jgi:two-component system chemotaxis response regulator CheB